MLIIGKRQPGSSFVKPVGFAYESSVAVMQADIMAQVGARKKETDEYVVLNKSLFISESDIVHHATAVDASA